MHENLVALRPWKFSQSIDACVQQRALERAAGALPLARQLLDPPGCLLGKRAERLPGGLPEPWEQFDDDVQRGVSADLPERRSGLAALEEESATLRIVREEPDRPLSVEMPKRSRLVLGLPVRIDQLEDGGHSVHELHARGIARGTGCIRLTEPQLPQVDALAD